MKQQYPIVMKVGGRTQGDLIMDSPFSLCGKVSDGIGVYFSNDGQCGWVIDFADFEQAYLAAKKFREENAQLVAEQKERYKHLLRRNLQ